MRLLFFYFFIFLFFYNSKAQVNLVPNPSFEIYSSCPSGPGQINKAIPWYDPTGASSDYFNVCSSTYGVPFGGGFQYARTGNAFAGIWAINSYGGNYREYLQIKLYSILQQDSCYLIEFYCNAANWTRYCVNKMGAYLSSTVVNSVGPGLVLQYVPQINSKQFLNDTLNWMRVSGYYQAIGDEQYLTIGNFSTDNNTDTLHIGGFYDGSAYFIDDVTVQKIVACDTITSIQEYAINTKFKLYPNPNDGKMIFEYSLSEKSSGTFILQDITGRVINKYSLSVGEKNSLTINEEELNNGIYFYSVIINNKVQSYDRIVIIK